MKSTLFWGVFIILSVILSRPEVGWGAERKQNSIASNGQTTITAGPPKCQIQVIITTHEMKARNEKEKKGTNPNCSNYNPRSVVDRIDIKVGGKAIAVPPSIFCDLTDLRTGGITAGQKEVLLTLDGGDASESYAVKIRFDAERVKHRALIDGESGRLLEETTYYRVIVDDEF